MNIRLTPEELAELKPTYDVLEATKDGYMQGIEAAKAVLLRRVLDKRTPPKEEQSNDVS